VTWHAPHAGVASLTAGQAPAPPSAGAAASGSADRSRRMHNTRGAPVVDTALSRMIDTGHAPRRHCRSGSMHRLRGLKPA
jgi:hypothetical protein